MPKTVRDRQRCRAIRIALNNAKMLGRIARQVGDDRDHNPYRSGDQAAERYEWFTGYDQEMNLVAA